MSLISLNEKVHIYSTNAINIGLIQKNNQVVLIDAGIDKSIAKKVLNELKANNWALKHIIITHAHADHFGGASYLKEQTNARLLAHPKEALIMSSPELEPFYLYGGATPIKDLQNKFLQGPFTTTDMFIQEGSLKLDDINLLIVPLPGHSIGQIGVCYEDILFSADAFFGEEVLNKHGIPYYINIEDTLKTLDFLQSKKNFIIFIPSHGNIESKIDNLLEKHITQIKLILNTILNIVDGNPMDTEKLLASLLSKLGLEIHAPSHFFLMRASLMAFLTYLDNKKLITWQIIENSMLWYKK